MVLADKYKTLLDKNGINTPLRLAHFFAQLAHESGLKPISENLNYSADGLIAVFKKYFVTTANAKLYARKPEAIANKVYANRMGNGNEKSGDGWKYRGRGFIQLTGKDNYKRLSEDTGIDYITYPDLLLDEADAMIAALWYWNKTGLNKHADADNLDAISDLINIGRVTSPKGDAHGYDKRLAQLKTYKKIFNVK